MSKLTKEEWDEIDKKLSGFCGIVHLRIDGYNVSLSLQFVKRFKQAILVYINDKIELNKMNDSEEAKRFWCPHRKYLYPAKERKNMYRICKKLGLLSDRSGKYIIMYWPYWTSFSKLKAHLIKNNESIELLKEELKHE